MDHDIDSGEKAIIILQSLICYLREKNILTRADIQELRDRVEERITDAGRVMPCAVPAAQAAAHEMAQLEKFCGKRYGGKHRRAN
ncbi:hypothetical protein [Sphingobium cupriresistens]|uniref:Uncharacterized protein n=1 Tax=Sphingobium cupriresistens LL01 TaxID=1420583 RepID=A0A0J7Y349_9SPHN|nr:hypothetical protein [Sphingobium cupriresistens]KMS58234.1 hypothetical protein V473_08835 [Sphingobium cupriresistens LL01]